MTDPQRTMPLRIAVKYGLPFVLGALSCLAMAPFNIWLVLFAGLSGLYICLSRCTTKCRGFLCGFAFSFGYFLFGLYWIGNALLVQGNPYWWAWPLAVSGLPFILSCFTGAACALYTALWKNKTGLWPYLTFCILLALAEYARGTLFTGFPWNLYGYTWISLLPVAQIASLHSIYLLTALTILWAVLPAFILCSRDSLMAKYFVSLLVISSLAASYIFGADRIAAYDAHAQSAQSSLKLVVVQPNIPQAEKWKSKEHIIQHFYTLLDLSQYQPNDDTDEHTPYLIVWPETAITQGFLDSPQALEHIRLMLGSYPAEAFLLTGVLRFENNKHFNSMFLLDKNADSLDIYDKSHLVPFGEYIPFSSILDIAPVVGFSNFEKGTRDNILTLPTSAQAPPVSIGAMICYEVIFPERARFAQSVQPDILVNVTNDAWYGDSPGPRQHLVQAQFRAIESGRPLIRSANTGISAIIAPTGTVIHRYLLNQYGTIRTKYP